MSSWQADSLAAMTDALPGADIEPYGSVTDPALLDGWSDLDVVITSHAAFEVQEALQERLWAFQSTSDGDAQVVRAVLADGRRIDATIHGTPGTLPMPPADNQVRFDTALAAVRFGRGSHLMALHLTLGVIREALVHRMVAADRTVGTTHHRSETRYCADAPLALEALAEPLGPQTALDAYELYGAWRSATEPGYSADAVGLQAVIGLGRVS
ncbi:hypothetical protein [Dermabacter sp. Marseille-Q3180]|uniref:hypothetical protein n=1 Tax=Dermabacter sp. Marseille-Q3180 TaxID=2758090 RepID=UPI0020253819|nr:hypothetical protein [Dermabacter sp. Marseille-Q3180]